MRLLACSILLILPVALPAQVASRYTISTLAGNGTSGSSGDGAPASAAQLATPFGVVVNASGAVLISDQANNKIRQVTTDGNIGTVAGTGGRSYSGDGAAATNSLMAAPAGVALDNAGAVYFSDSLNDVVRKFSLSGNIATIAGNFNNGPGFSGDNGAATSASLNTPVGIAVDSTGNIYVADRLNNRIRKISATGTITAFAGNGVAGSSGDGGLATAATMRSPAGLAIDSAGTVYIADTGNHRVRKVTSDGKISNVAGIGAAGYSGDLGNATLAGLNSPAGIAVDKTGNLYIADTSNSRIRRVSPGGIITTIAGNGRFAYAGDGGAATSASLFFPGGVAVGSSGNVYIADTQNNVVRVLTPIPDSALPPVITGVIGAGSFGATTAVAPGSWIEIYGSDLAGTARSWAGADFTGVAAPQILDGTTVKVGGQLAVLSYISGGQVNALVPAGLGSGDQTLTVNTLVGVSQPSTLRIDGTQPAFYAPPVFKLQGTQYVGAAFADGSGYVLPASASTGVTSRPAKTGDIIVVYGIGFGPVFPDVPYGQVAQASNAITGSLQVFLGETQAAVSYAGLSPSSVGLYQFNVTVPAGVSGDTVPFTYSVNGVKTRQTLYTSVQK
jgi:uncharacterized protein (TIGR03437 family)